MKKIKINGFQFIETDDDITVTKAQAEGLEITDIPRNPDSYARDGSDRPETIAAKAAITAQRESQGITDETINRPNLLESLKGLDNEFTEAERDAMDYSDLVEYHSMMVQKPQLVQKANELGITDAKDLSYEELVREIKRIVMDNG